MENMINSYESYLGRFYRFIDRGMSPIVAEVCARGDGFMNCFRYLENILKINEVICEYDRNRI